MSVLRSLEKQTKEQVDGLVDRRRGNLLSGRSRAALGRCG